MKHIVVRPAGPKAKTFVVARSYPGDDGFFTEVARCFTEDGARRIAEALNRDADKNKPKPRGSAG